MPKYVDMNQSLKFVLTTSFIGIVLCIVSSFVCFYFIFYDAFSLIKLLTYRIIITWLVAPVIGLMICKIIKNVYLIPFVIFLTALIIYIVIGICTDSITDSSLRGWYLLLYLIYGFGSLPMLYVIKFLAVKYLY